MHTFAPCKQVAILATPRQSSNEFDSALGLHRIADEFKNEKNSWNVIGCQSFLNQPLLAWAHPYDKMEAFFHENLK